MAATTAWVSLNLPDKKVRTSGQHKKAAGSHTATFASNTTLIIMEGVVTVVFDASKMGVRTNGQFGAVTTGR